MHTDTPVDDLTGSELRKDAAHKDEPISNTAAMVAGDWPMLVEASVVSTEKHLTAAAAALPEGDMPELIPARINSSQVY